MKNKFKTVSDLTYLIRRRLSSYTSAYKGHPAFPEYHNNKIQQILE